MGTYRKGWTLVLFIAVVVTLFSLPLAHSTEHNMCTLAHTLEDSETFELKSLSVDGLFVSPSAEEPGTIFTITATVSDDITIQSVRAAIIRGILTVDTITLYDDGAHGDGAAGDGIYGNTWDSTGSTDGIYKVSITSENTADQSEIVEFDNAFELMTGECTAIDVNGGSENLDIVFVPCDYEVGENAKFAADAQAHYEEIVNFYPFNNSAHKINGYRVDRLGEMSCTYNGRCLLAPGAEVQQLASSCSNRDKIIVIADSTEWAGCAYLGGVAHSSSQYPWISVHEFGHSFSRLLDEYSYGPSGSSPGPGPNCDGAGCPRWAGTPGTGCYEQCNYDNLYRPTVASTMRNANNQDFGPVSSAVIDQYMSQYG